VFSFVETLYCWWQGLSAISRGWLFVIGLGLINIVIGIHIFCIYFDLYETYSNKDNGENHKGVV